MRVPDAGVQITADDAKIWSRVQAKGERLQEWAEWTRTGLVGHGVPLQSLENPDTSMMWLSPGTVAWQLFMGGSVVRMSYCSYGMPWRKNTRIHFTGDGFKVLGRMCSNFTKGYVRPLVTFNFSISQAPQT